MTDVSRILGERMKVDLDESDREQSTSVPAMPVDELIQRLSDVSYALAAGDDPDPPTRLRHLHTIDLAIARLRKA